MKIALRFACLTCGCEVIATGESYHDTKQALLHAGWHLENLRDGWGRCPPCHGLNSNELLPNSTERKDLTNEST
jgi:hypothetical protein